MGNGKGAVCSVPQAPVDFSALSHWPENVMQPLQLPRSLGKQVAKEKDIGKLSAELRLQTKSPNFKTSSVPTKSCPNDLTYTQEMLSVDPPTSCQSSTLLIVCPQPGAATVVALPPLGTWQMHMSHCGQWPRISKREGYSLPLHSWALDGSSKPMGF